VSTAGNLLSRHLCEIGFTMFAKTVEAMKSGEFSYDIREIQMMVSLMGGFANAQTGTSLAHGMSYALTHEKGIPHGLACGLLIKNYLDIFKDKSRVNRIMTLCGFSSLEDFGKFIDDILILDIDISEEEIEKYSIEFAAQKHRFLRHPEPVGIEEIRRIYKNSLLRYR
jgi:alcohol dehydrogenase